MDELTLPLVDIISKSNDTGIFPSKLKQAKIYLKLKEGDPTHESNI